jgi:hypothetical protein
MLDIHKFLSWSSTKTEGPIKMWGDKKYTYMYIHFNKGYLWTFSKLNINVMYGVQCHILSKDGTSHMNATNYWAIYKEWYHSV